jgi:hypothetical protein
LVLTDLITTSRIDSTSNFKLQRQLQATLSHLNFSYTAHTAVNEKKSEGKKMEENEK